MSCVYDIHRLATIRCLVHRIVILRLPQHQQVLLFCQKLQKSVIPLVKTNLNVVVLPEQENYRRDFETRNQNHLQHRRHDSTHLKLPTNGSLPLWLQQMHRSKIIDLQKPKSRSIEASTSAPNQASVEIGTTYRRLVEEESQPNNRPPVSKADRKIRAGIVDNLGFELHTHKLTLGSNRKEQYGVYNTFFEQRRHFYGYWLSLNAIKSAVKRYQKKHAKSTAEVTPQPASDSVSPGSSSQPPSLVEATVATDTDESIASDLSTVTAGASPPHQSPTVTAAVVDSLSFAPSPPAVNDAAMDLLLSTPMVNLGGRPNGLTVAAKNNIKHRKL